MSALLYPTLLLVHLLAAIVWLGGMVFAHFALRPAAIQVLQAPQRLPLMTQALGRFFRLAAASAVAILASGGALTARVGMAQAPLGWHVMMTLGVVMAAIFTLIYAMLYPRLRSAVDQQLWPAAAAVLNRIRTLVLVNLGMGTLAVGAAVLARA